MQYPELTPRLTEIPDVSEKALTLFSDNLVWDNVFPWGLGRGEYRGNAQFIDELLPRFKRVGSNFLSLSLLGATVSPANILEYIGRVRREIAERSDWMVLATSVAAIREAKAADKLAVNFDFQSCPPLGNSLDLIQVYYDLGVRQAGLAYNLRTVVGDGCAEGANAGLSRLGVTVIKEMNRVGMLVDGSHAGFRTTMDAMEVCDGPFTFSHSNPMAVCDHYRSITDEQIKACVATGGVVGINGVGTFVGDDNAPTEAIFRCLDYTVELVGAEHVGLGFDYVHDNDGSIKALEKATLAWPPHKGKSAAKHNYASHEQVIELVQMMLDRGYPDEAIIGILGENWASLCEKVWK